MNLNLNESSFFINRYKEVLGILYTRLKTEMMVLKNCLEHNYELEDLLRTCKLEVYPNVFKLIQVVLSIPISSSTSTCERSFSSMRRIKNWLRTSMVQNRFTNLSSLCIERDLTNSINNEINLNKLAQKLKRINLF